MVGWRYSPPLVLDLPREHAELENVTMRVLCLKAERIGLSGVEFKSPPDDTYKISMRHVVMKRWGVDGPFQYTYPQAENIYVTKITAREVEGPVRLMYKNWELTSTYVVVRDVSVYSTFVDAFYLRFRTAWRGEQKPPELKALTDPLTWNTLRINTSEEIIMESFEIKSR